MGVFNRRKKLIANEKLYDKCKEWERSPNSQTLREFLGMNVVEFKLWKETGEPPKWLWK